MKDPKVSIIVPVCNVEKYVRQCVQSLMKQTMSEIEIICINDGSTDTSPEILRQLQQQDSRIRIVDKENSGYGDTVNMGIALARGQYIGILESDDFASSNMYELLYRKAIENDADLVKSNFYCYYTERNEDVFNEYLVGLPYDRVLRQKEQAKLLSRSPAIWSGIYKKSLLVQKKIDFLPTPGASYQDISFAYKTILCSKKTVLVQDALVHYRSDNVKSSVKSEGKVFYVCEEFEEIKRFIVENGYKRGIPSYARVMYSRYKWNLDRVSKENKVRFLAKMYLQLRELSFAGWIQREGWEDAGWQEVHNFIFNFSKVYKAVLKGETIVNWQRADKEAVLTVLKDSHPLLIYGAGQRGKRLLAALQRYQIVPDGIVVTNLVGNPKTIEDISVMDVQYVASHLRDALILLGIADKLKEEVLDVLAQYHLCGNYLSVDSEMLRILETDEVLE